MSLSMGLMNKQVVEIKEPDPEYQCLFCQNHEINVVEWGPMYHLQNVTVHYFCLLFSAGLCQRGKDNEGIWGFLAPDILKEAKRGDKLKCKYCKKSRATVGCIVKTCKYSFHYSCGFSRGTLHQFYGSFSSYCPQHKPVQRIPSEAEWECPICFVEVENQDEGVWPPCCGKKLFHRRCLMHTAKEAGYFFKCPLCNNATDKFLLAMKENGVFVPEQDAAWEREPNAFSELQEQYSRCDAKLCLCPEGREADSKEDLKWKIIRCNCCGASAVHSKCAGLQAVLSWKCPTCMPVLLDNSGVSTSTLVSEYRSRRTRVDERNLNYSDSEDETSEGDSWSDDDGTSDEEERILRSIPNAATIVRTISSSTSDSSDSDSGENQNLPPCSTNALPTTDSVDIESESETEKGEIVRDITTNKEFRVLRKRVQKTLNRSAKKLKHQAFENSNDQNMNQELSPCSSSSPSSNSSNPKPEKSSGLKKRKGSFQKKLDKLGRLPPDRINELTSEEQDELIQQQLESIYRNGPSVGSEKRRFLEAKKQQEILQSYLRDGFKAQAELAKLHKIPKVVPGSSQPTAAEERRSILVVNDKAELAPRTYAQMEEDRSQERNFKAVEIEANSLTDAPELECQPLGLSAPLGLHNINFTSSSEQIVFTVREQVEQLRESAIHDYDERLHREFNMDQSFQNLNASQPSCINDISLPLPAQEANTSPQEFEPDDLTSFQNSPSNNSPEFSSPSSPGNSDQAEDLWKIEEELDCDEADEQYSDEEKPEKVELKPDVDVDIKMERTDSIGTDAVEIIDLEDSENSDNEIEILSSKVVPAPTVYTTKSAAFASLLGNRENAPKSSPIPSKDMFYHSSCSDKVPHDYWFNSQNKKSK